MFDRDNAAIHAVRDAKTEEQAVAALVAAGMTVAEAKAWVEKNRQPLRSQFAREDKARQVWMWPFAMGRDTLGGVDYHFFEVRIPVPYKDPDTGRWGIAFEILRWERWPG